MKKQVIQNRGVLFKWLLSYMVVLALPLTTSYFLNKVSTDALNKEIHLVNANVLTQIRSSIDEKLKEMEKLALFLGSDSNLLGLVEKNADKKMTFHYDLHKLVSDFKSLLAANDSISDFYVVFHNADIVVTPGAVLNHEQAYSILHKNQEMSYVQWKQQVMKPYIRGYVTCSRRLSTSSEVNTRVIAYMHSLISNDLQNAAATVVVMTDERQLQPYLSIQGELQDSEIYLLNANNEVMLSSTKSTDLPVQLNFDDLNEGVWKNITTKGIELAVINNKSSITNYKYVGFMEYSQNWKRLMDMRKLSLCLILAGFIGGFLAACWFTWRKYVRISDLLQFIVKNLKIKKPKQDDEFVFIRNAMNLTINEKENLKQEYDQQKGILFRTFLNRLLRGEISPLTMTEDTIRFYGFQDVTPNWMVVLFHFDMKKSSGYEEYSLIRKKDILSEIKEILNQNIPQGYGIYITEIDDMIAALVNTNDRNPGKLQNICRKAGVVLKEMAICGITIYSAVSSIHGKSLQGIATCYTEALEVLEYSIMFGVNTVMSYNQLGKHYQTFEYSIDMEQKLINNIRSGNADSTRSLLYEVFEKNISKNKIGLDMLKILMLNLVSTAIKAADSNTVSKLMEDIQPVRCIDSCQTIPEVKQQMTSILLYVCESCKENEKTRNEKLCSDVMDYIKENYTNPELSVTYISEKFEFSPIYLSNVFNKCAGVSIMDYAHRCRVEMACEYLNNSYKSAKEIAALVGYIDINTFSRNFKKCKGITPGEYRKIGPELENQLS
ncbi:MAG TPA: AraC family transcriptional regulator [Clostridiales bacterium]|nr:AraC family transcriptional regulator [Clostridiales bacterium]